ncbi:MAG: ATP-dependent zinc metalloprotease FtsH [Coriobacteriaceae bacterium]|nr:ATP-dependent zinc metalloprotease FtsH [Coriobacteriaceae bacterium]
MSDEKNDQIENDEKNEANGTGEGGSKKPNFRKPTNQSTVISIISTAVIVLLLFMMLFGRGGMESQKTDQLLTSDFTAAVQQNRVAEVNYTPAEYSVTGKYYPAVTVGALASEGINAAFNAMNTSLAHSKGVNVTGVQTTDIAPIQVGEKRNFTATYGSQGSLDALMATHPEIEYKVSTPNGVVGTLLSLLPMLLLIGLMVFFFYQMSKANNQQMSFGRARAKKLTEERPDVHFSDVAGCDEAVEEMREIRDFLANPKKYQEIGAKIPHGVLLVGPPGTGKTLLARAVAGEADVPFFSISGSDFVEMFVGVGASRVRDLFNEAKEAAPSIIFIDEIDAVGRQRGAGLGGGHDEREQTLNQLLVEMDGFDANTSVVLIAATNRSDVLDPALLRPGRFDRQIVVDAPDVKGREKILNVHAKNKPLARDVDLKSIAKLTPGFTGADLANLLNEAALLTARREKKVISMDEVRESMERVIAGPERKGRVIDEDTRKTIAYHESGHALVGHLLEHADPVHKISIISRGRALGYTMSIPAEDKVMNSLREMHDQLAVLLGGRTAEEIFCDDITTGASNDLERATKIARSMVTQYGMSAELGAQIFGQPNHEVFLGRDYGNTQDYSDETARRIDDEVARIMQQAHERARQVLLAHQDQMHLMASVLLERETVEDEACQALLDNRWAEYVAREQSEEGRRKRHLDATTVVNQPEAPAESQAQPEPPVSQDPPAGVPIAQPVAPRMQVPPVPQRPVQPQVPRVPEVPQVPPAPQAPQVPQDAQQPRPQRRTPSGINRNQRPPQE